MPAFDSWENELYHFGILGMKWGVRRYQNPDGSYTNAGLRHRRVSRMTDEELKRGIERRKLEKEYRDLGKRSSGSLERIATSIIAARERQAERKSQEQERELKRIQSNNQVRQAKYAAKKADFERQRAEAETETAQAKKDLYKKELINERRAKAAETVHGAFRIRLATAISKTKNWRERGVNNKKLKLERLNLDKKITELNDELVANQEKKRQELEQKRKEKRNKS